VAVDFPARLAYQPLGAKSNELNTFLRGDCSGGYFFLMLSGDRFLGGG
jgi:hypothetical protein